MNQPLTDIQKARLKVLEPKLAKAIENREFSTAKSLVSDLQSLLRPTGHFVRLSQSKNRLYELYIELGKYDLALNGLLSNRDILSQKTRVYLETVSLVAICYIRMQEVEKAKPFIKEVLTNHMVIKSERTRKIFRLEMINRFNEEVSLCTLKSSSTPDFTETDLESEVIRIVQTLTEDEIYASMGQAAPQSTKDLIFQVYEYSTKQLQSAERLALPSPNQKIMDKEVGLTIFQSVKRVVYRSLCDPESDIYQAWFKNGMQMVLSKGYISTAVISCLANLGIGIKMIAASIIALITKFGIEVYCEKYKPVQLMEIRKR